MLTLSVVIVPNQNWSPDHTIQSELLGFLTPVFWRILTQHLSGSVQLNPPIRAVGFLFHAVGQIFHEWANLT